MIFLAAILGRTAVADYAPARKVNVEAMLDLIDHLREAALMPDLGNTRALALPALKVRFGDLVAALRRAFPKSPRRVIYEPDARFVSLLGHHPRLQTDTVNALGLSHNTDLDALIAGST